MPSRDSRDSCSISSLPLAVFTLEFFHEISQRLAARLRHGVVDGSAQAADGAMAFEAAQASSRSFGDKLLFEIF